MAACMIAGEWTPTGWGAQHRVRSAEGAFVVLVCHSETQRVEAARINAEAAEADRCTRCARTPGLGPMLRPSVGEVRRHASGALVVCVETWDHRQPAPHDLCWMVVANGAWLPTRWLDSYAVADWDFVETVTMVGAKSPETTPA